MYEKLSPKRDWKAASLFLPARLSWPSEARTPVKRPRWAAMRLAVSASAAVAR